MHYLDFYKFLYIVILNINMFQLFFSDWIECIENSALVITHNFNRNEEIV
jgi:hypothetical protein